MCGRFTLTTPADVLAEVFELAETPPLSPRYNIAPTQAVAAVRAEAGARRCDLLHWGLIPFWADDPAIGNRMINARADGVASKPSFRAAFKKRRCLVLADGFYEWQKVPGSRQKQPFYIHLRDHHPFAFAGLWEHWEGGDGSAVDSCTIITTNPNELMEPIHDRMPVILPASSYDTWLDPDCQNAPALNQLLLPFPAKEMQAYPISKKVNKPTYDAPDCIEPTE